MVKRPVVPRLAVYSTAEEAHQVVEGHRILKVDLVMMTIFRGTENFVDMLVLLVDYRTEGESQLSAE
jgi:hypothetical protein